VHYRHRETVYHIAVRQSRPAQGHSELRIDGHAQDGLAIPLVDDRQEHWVDLTVVR